jgi:uncharacterized protein YkuJ
MLKIRDEIDLKELEKFGYKQGQDMCNVSYSAYGKVFEVEYSEKLSDMLIDIVEINKKGKKIELSRSSKKSCRSFINDDEKELKQYIDDLIKADLVEEVSNE